MTTENRMETSTAVACPKCGSTHFWKEEYRQYLQAGYSATPGGNLIATGEPVTVRRCLSGHIVDSSVRRSLPQDQQVAFRESLALARKREADIEPQAILEVVQQSYVSKAEFDAKVEEFERLAASLANENPVKK